MPHQFTLSAFADEIDDDLATQIRVLASEEVRHIEFRGAWGKNILDLSPAELKKARVMLDAAGFGLSALGTPIGKSPIANPPSFEHERLERAFRAGEALGTKNLRVFSYFVEASKADSHREEVISRMGELARRCAAQGYTLWHENEREIYGDEPQRCLAIMQGVNLPNLRMAFDPANFVQTGVNPMQDAWPLLADWTTHVHIKDAVMSDGHVTPAGEGDGGVPELIAQLKTRGYRGFLTLEPHLKVAGKSGGYSGEDGMRIAINALRKLL